MSNYAPGQMPSQAPHDTTSKCLCVTNDVTKPPTCCHKWFWPFVGPCTIYNYAPVDRATGKRVLPCVYYVIIVLTVLQWGMTLFEMFGTQLTQTEGVQPHANGKVPMFDAKRAIFVAIEMAIGITGTIIMFCVWDPKIQSVLPRVQGPIIPVGAPIQVVAGAIQ